MDVDKQVAWDETMKDERKRLGRQAGGAASVLEVITSPGMVALAALGAAIYWLDRLTGGHLPHIQRKEQARLEHMQRDHEMLRSRLF